MATFCSPQPATAALEQEYLAIKKDYLLILEIPETSARAEALRRIIDRFQALLSRDTGLVIADKCLYMIAQGYHHLHDMQHGPRELAAALKHYRALVESFPSSPLADDAQYLIGVLLTASDRSAALHEFKKVAILFPKGDMKGPAAARVRALEDHPGGPADRAKADRAPRPAEGASPQVRGGPPGASLGTIRSGPSLARQLALGIHCIVLDPGHGGRDKGASSPNGVLEKDLVLELSKILKRQMETKFGCRVVLTRSTDRTLSLDDRTRIANEQRADVFLSIHANAHADPSIHGFETYFLDFAKDRESARVAALENAAGKKHLSDLQALLEKLLLTTRSRESASLAKHVHDHVTSGLAARKHALKDLGVKHAPFHVLLGTEMPGILIETGFLTNQKDTMRLTDKSFQNEWAAAVTEGMNAYIVDAARFARTGYGP